MTAQDLAQGYVQVSTAARELGVSASAVYPMLSRGRLSGLVVDGKWLVERSSIAAVKSRASASKPSADPPPI